MVQIPRWGEGRQFLEDVGTDLMLLPEPIESHVLEIDDNASTGPSDAWRRLTPAIARALGVAVSDAGQPVERVGFCHLLRQLFQAAEVAGVPVVLMLEGAGRLPLEVAQDISEAFRTHMDRHPVGRVVNLVVAAQIGASWPEIPGAARFVVPDYGPSETIVALAEQLGGADPEVLGWVASVVGGVPALVEAMGRVAALPLMGDRAAVRAAVATLGDEMRGAMTILRSDGVLAQRLEFIAGAGEAPWDAVADRVLLDAGIIHRTRFGRTARASVRSPLVEDFSAAI